MAKEVAASSNWATVYFDGGAEPNPGPAAGAAVLDLPSGESVSVTVDLGVATNNIAEYSGCIAGLKKALELEFFCVMVRGDSQLVIKQLQGEYAVKAANLQPFYLEARQLLVQFESYRLEWIPRSQNSRADAAAGLVLAAGRAPVVTLPDDLPMSLPVESLKGKIERLIRQGNKASFKDFLALKSGRDQFSLLRGEALVDVVPVEVREAIASQLNLGEESEFVAKTYRWWLRGLPVSQALRKVRVDAEVAANVTRRRA